MDLAGEGFGAESPTGLLPGDPRRPGGLSQEGPLPRTSTNRSAVTGSHPSLAIVPNPTAALARFTG